MIDRTFRNMNRLFVLSLKNRNKYPRRDSFDVYYIHSRIKYFNVSIDSKPFFDKSVKIRQDLIYLKCT